MQRKLSQSDTAIKQIKDHLVKIEDCASLVVIKKEVDDIRTLADQNAKDIAFIKTRLDDSEDRARCSNLVFFGLTDCERETWAESESLIVELCRKELNRCRWTSSVDIERDHRLGKFKVSNRPIILKLSHFKVKEQILSHGRKLKGTEYRISEDYSPNTLTARRRLVEFAKTQQKPFKLRHDKLTIGNKAYTFDCNALKVVPRTLNAQPPATLTRRRISFRLFLLTLEAFYRSLTLSVILPTQQSLI